MQNVLITGANRGIGFEFVRQYVSAGNRVFAACRNPDEAQELQKLYSKFPERLKILQLEVSDPASIRKSHSSVAEEIKALDILINNAGVYSTKGSRSPKEELGHLSFDDALFVIRINAIAPIIIAQEYLDLLRSSKNAKIINMTSGYGSISNNTSGFPFYYSASKAALNQLTRSLAADVKKWKITAIVMDPGWVATDMGGSGAPVTPEESVRSMIEVVEGLDSKQNGQYLNRFGQRENW
jgi:NAD(P)-dependent dehydrogenase (short-subunit alcohol dehydrogenase family)